MISLKFVQEIHDSVIASFGGSKGVRDYSLLEAAIARPYQTFDGIELYPTPIDKAAAVLESILTNHPFVDGNKRTGYVLMRLMLLKSNTDINANEETKYDFVINVAEGKSDFDTIKAWLLKNTVKL